MNRRYLVAMLLVFVLGLAFGGAILAQSPAVVDTNVTRQMSFEDLVPGMAPEVIQKTRDLSKSWLDLSAQYERESQAMAPTLDKQREAKKAEVEMTKKQLDLAKAAKDDAQKAKFEQAVKDQELQLQILESVKGLAKANDEMARMCAETGRAGNELADIYQGFASNRDKMRSDFKQAVEQSSKAGVEPPAMMINYEDAEKALKSLDNYGGKLEGLGKEIRDASKARAEFVKRWKQYMMQSVK